MSEDGAGPVELGRVTAEVHGRFLVRRGRGRGVLAGFHGFGETAEVVMEQLLLIPGLEEWTLVSVQALHPFYRRSGEVVACWMTRQDRELAIEENVAYVRRVLEEVMAAEEGETPLVTLGFSQGTAMAYRAAAYCGFETRAVIALGGDAPPELSELETLSFEAALIGRGTAEDWYTLDQVERDRALLSDLGVEVSFFEFDGGHEWTAAFRAETARFLASTAGVPE